MRRRMKRIMAKNKKVILISILIFVIICIGYGLFSPFSLNCISNEIWQEIIASRPELLNEEDEIERLNLIRDYVYEKTPFAQGGELVIDQKYPARHIYAEELGKYYTIEYYRKILDLDEELGGGVLLWRNGRGFG